MKLLLVGAAVLGAIVGTVQGVALVVTEARKFRTGVLCKAWVSVGTTSPSPIFFSACGLRYTFPSRENPIQTSKLLPTAFPGPPLPVAGDKLCFFSSPAGGVHRWLQSMMNVKLPAGNRRPSIEKEISCTLEAHLVWPSDVEAASGEDSESLSDWEEASISDDRFGFHADNLSCWASSPPGGQGTCRHGRQQPQPDPVACDARAQV